MALIQWWVGVTVIAVAAVVGMVAWWRPHRSRQGVDVLVAGADRVRVLPSWAPLVRQECRRRQLALAGVGLVVCGLALLGARFVMVTDDSEALRHRDVVLCMDVSGSMVPTVEDVLDTYVALAAELTQERVGFVMFDANAVTGFALTDDHDEVAARLVGARQELLSEEPVAGTTAPASGSSLVGDGLASCVQHFDRPDETRARTLVLATDNLVSGDSIYSLSQATDLAVDRNVMVFGVTPQGVPPHATAELRAQTARTHGGVLVLTPGQATNTQVIQRAVSKQERTALLATAQERSFDVTIPGALLTLAGTVLTAAADRRRR